MNLVHIFIAGVLLTGVHIVGGVLMKYVGFQFNWYAVLGFIVGAYYYHRVTVDEVRLFRHIHKHHSKEEDTDI
jgi:uncharacterized membrane protein YciS (DUF1049 family)